MGPSDVEKKASLQCGQREEGFLLAERLAFVFGILLASKNSVDELVGRSFLAYPILPHPRRNNLSLLLLLASLSLHHRR